MFFVFVTTLKKLAGDILYEEMDDFAFPANVQGYRGMMAAIYWEDCGLSVWSDPAFAAQTALAKWDSDPDNPDRFPV